MVEYVIEGRIAVITGCDEDETELIIPEYVEGFPVGKIEENAFNEFQNLEKVVFPRTLKLIGEYAFAGCSNLTSVEFQEGLETISDWAFISCNIEEIRLPSTLKNMGENAFLGNPVKYYIDEFNADLLSKKLKSNRNYLPMAFFPIGLLESVENLTEEVINEYYRYQSGQVLTFEQSKSIKDLDLPLVFDEDEFIIAVHSKARLTDFKILVSADSRKKMGLYEADDPNTLLLGLQVLSKGDFLGEISVVVPYLEEAEFKVIDVLAVEDKTYCYYLRISANLSCFGTGNPNYEFSFQMFDVLDEKYQTQCKQQLISKEDYEQMKKEIHDSAIDTLKSFLQQVSGTPVLTFVIEMFTFLLNSEEFEEKERVVAFVEQAIDDAYRKLGNYESFAALCFEMDNALDFIKEYTGLSLDEIKEQYGIYIKNEKDEPLRLEDMNLYREVFVLNEFNYTLYAEFLNYIYQFMRKLNMDFSMRTFQE